MMRRKLTSDYPDRRLLNVSQFSPSKNRVGKQKALRQSAKSVLRSACLGGVLAVLSGCFVAPKPVTISEINTFAAGKADVVTLNQEPISGSLDLYEAMARALKYNLDFRVEVAAKAVQASKLGVANSAGLPDFVAGVDFAGRNNYSGGTSFSLLSGTESLEPSTSSERNVFNNNLQLSWNILDFGLSYARAKQTANEVLIAEELKRKIVNKIIEDVRTAYWRALGAQRIVGRLKALRSKVTRALSDSERLLRSGETEPLTELTYQRELAQIELELKKLNSELKVSKAQLAALINTLPGENFTLVNSRQPQSQLKLKGDMQTMISTALENRPEIREALYKSKIDKREADIALLELLPGIQVFVGPDWNTNSFLYNNNWIGWGAQASWNLINLFKYPLKKKQLEAQTDLLHRRALALTMAIMTQVHVSRLRHYHAADAYYSARKINRIQHRILKQLKQSEQAGAISEQTLIREEMNTIVSDVRNDIAYASLQSAYASAQVAMGLDAYDNKWAVNNAVFTDRSVDELANELRRVWKSR